MNLPVYCRKSGLRFFVCVASHKWFVESKMFYSCMYLKRGNACFFVYLMDISFILKSFAAETVSQNCVRKKCSSLRWQRQCQGALVLNCGVTPTAVFSPVLCLPKTVKNVKVKQKPPKFAALHLAFDSVMSKHSFTYKRDIHKVKNKCQTRLYVAKVQLVKWHQLCF